jgi:hypothetical protein
MKETYNYWKRRALKYQKGIWRWILSQHKSISNFIEALKEKLQTAEDLLKLRDAEIMRMKKSQKDAVSKIN